MGQKLVEGEVAIPAASALGRRGAGRAPAGIASSPLAALPRSRREAARLGDRRCAGGRPQTARQCQRPNVSCPGLALACVSASDWPGIATFPSTGFRPQKTCREAAPKTDERQRAARPFGHFPEKNGSCSIPKDSQFAMKEPGNDCFSG